MRIKNLQIRGFKSLLGFELENLKPFCAFVGPNASGKSNIFEALEFTNYTIRYGNEALNFFGGLDNILSYQMLKFGQFSLDLDYEFIDNILIGFSLEINEGNYRLSSTANEIKNTELTSLEIRDIATRKKFIQQWQNAGHSYSGDFEQFADNFSRIFVGKSSLVRTPPINTKLSTDASNLSQIIGAIFQDKERRGDFTEWLRILIPEFKNIEIKRSNIDGTYEFFIFEKGSEIPFPKNLISDGTYNILSLMAAVYQTNQPQFLCIEEPENGLHPQAIELLVDFFREKSEEEGHHIWLNTHSQTLVRCLEIDEIILVNKVDGATKAKQLTKDDEVNIKTDEAWLTNALGGGVLWSK